MKIFPLKYSYSIGYPTFWGYLNEVYYCEHQDRVSQERAFMARGQFFRKYFLKVLFGNLFIDIPRSLKTKLKLYISYNVFDLSANGKLKGFIGRLGGQK